MKQGLALEGFLLEDGTVQPYKEYDDTELREMIQENTDKIDNIRSIIDDDTAVQGDFIAYGADGKHVDSGKKADDFANAAHSHTFLTNVTSHKSLTLDDDGEVSLGAGSIVIGIEEYDSDIEINKNNAANLKRALLDPAAPADPTAQGYAARLITNGQVFTALAGKSNTDHTHSGYAASSHTHLPVEVSGVVPTFMEYSGSAIDLDDIVDDAWGMMRLCIENTDSSGMTLSAFTSGSNLPIHINSLTETSEVASGEYAIVTVYKIDKDMNADDSHEHDLCYFITLDGIFDNGNPTSQQS